MKMLLSLALTLFATMAVAATPTPLPTAPAGKEYRYNYASCTGSSCVYNGVSLYDMTPPVAGCTIPGRATSTKIAHNYAQTGAKVVDATKADNLFGTFYSWTNINPFPWDQGFTVFSAVKRNEYIAAQFTVPVNVNPLTVGTLYKGETMPGPKNIVSISEVCGDFAPSTPNCVGSSGSPGQGIMKYKVPTAVGTACVLQPGKTYYMNIKQANPAEQNPFCNAITCLYVLQTNH